MSGRKWLAAAGAVVLSCAVAWAHGGGGGGGGGHGGGVVYFGGGYVAPTSPPDPELGDTRAIHTVAVLSGFAQTLHLTTGGMFGNRKTVDIKHWGLDEYASALVKKHLAPRFDVHDIAYDHDALAKIPKGDSGEALARLRAYFASMRNPGVDAFVVLRPDDPGAYQMTPGVEVVAGYPADQLGEGLGYEIEMFDARTFARIARSFARIQTREDATAALPIHLVGSDRLPGPDLALTDSQQVLIRNDFEWGIAETAVDTLRSLQWGLDIPPPGMGQLKPWPAGQSAFPQVHTIAIVSAVGDKLELGYRGTMFRHGIDTMPIADWNLDSEIESLVAAGLNRSFVVKQAAADRSALAGNVVLWPPSSVAGLTPSNDVDAYLVVFKHAGIDSDLQDEVTGLGVSKRNTISDETTYVFADYTLALLDARTLAPLIFKVGVASPHYANPKPYRLVTNADWTYGATVLAAEQSASVHQSVHDIIGDSLGETLIEMGLAANSRLPLDTPDAAPWTPEPLVVVDPEKPRADTTAP
jgi:hypothetical protein